MYTRAHACMRVWVRAHTCMLICVSAGQYLDGSGRAGQRDQCPCSLVLDSGAGGLQQVVDAADEAGTLRGVGVAHLHTRATAVTSETSPWEHGATATTEHCQSL